MAGTRGKPRPAISPEAARIGEALRNRRISDQVNKRQEDIALDAEISQKLVSQIERGEQDLRTSGFNTIMGLLKALKWTLADLQQATSLDFGVLDLPESLRTLPPAFPAPIYARRDEVYMPQGLLDAIKLFGEVPEYAELQEPEIQRQLAQVRGFDGGPQTAGEWLEFYRANRPWLKTDN